jgi:hypothetical protein
VFRLDPAAEDEVRKRLGHQEADAFLARLEHLSFDIAEPLEQVYGGVADTTAFVTELVLDALHQARCVRSTSGDPVTGADRIELPAWGFAWLTGT